MKGHCLLPGCLGLSFLTLGDIGGGLSALAVVRVTSRGPALVSSEFPGNSVVQSG